MEFEGKSPGGSKEELRTAISADESPLIGNNSKQSNLEEKPSSFTLKFITWNIDGLHTEHLKARTEAVCKIIEKEEPDIVFLQEVIPLTADYIARKLCNYYCYFAAEDPCIRQKSKKDSENEKGKENKNDMQGENDKEDEGGGTDEEDEEKGEWSEKKANEKSGYFTGTLLKKSSVSSIHAELIDFGVPFSVMGRNLLKINVKFKGLPMCLLNSHLESLKDYYEQRKDQLNLFVFRNMLDAPEYETVIFGGDTNLEEHELAELGGLPPGIEDLWVTCGRQERYAYTFDLYQNDNLRVKSKKACRYDRVFVRRSSPSKLKPVSFELIGLERLAPYGCFPSDHWGILCHFETDDFTFKLDEGFSEDSDDIQVLQPYWMKKPTDAKVIACSMVKPQTGTPQPKKNSLHKLYRIKNKSNSATTCALI